jgi:hypothetical protein
MEDPKLHKLLQQALTKVKIPAVSKEARFAKMIFVAQHSPAGRTLYSNTWCVGFAVVIVKFMTLNFV